MGRVLIIWGPGSVDSARSWVGVDPEEHPSRSTYVSALSSTSNVHGRTTSGTAYVRSWDGGCIHTSLKGRTLVRTAPHRVRASTAEGFVHRGVVILSNEVTDPFLTCAERAVLLFASPELD